MAAIASWRTHQSLCGPLLNEWYWIVNKWRKIIQAVLALVMVVVTLGVVFLPRIAPAQRAAQAAQPAARPTQVTQAKEPSPEIKRETRALWVSRWDFKSRDDVQKIVDKAAYAHMNTIIFQVRGQADALYPSNIEPWAADLTGKLGQDPGYDPLGDLVTAAHAKGIEVHAWLNVFPAWMGTTPPSASVKPTPMYQDFNARYGNDWVQWQGSKPQGLGQEGYLAANPAHPAVGDRVVAVTKDLLTRYPLDGIHLDYIRYSGPEYSEDPVSNAAYAAAKAKNPGLTRDDWQRAQVTAVVERVRNEAMPVRPNARLTATAWPVYKDRWGWYKHRDGYGTYYQDSQTWAKSGLVSGIMPMIYGPTVHDHSDWFEALARDYVDGSQPGSVIVGIGADYDSFAPIAQRIEMTRKVGAKGQGFFSYRAMEEHNYWQALRDGPYSEPALPSWR